MLDAVRDGMFHIWAVRTIDEGIEVLTSVPAGEKLADGSYPEGSINALADQHLFTLAEQLVEFGEPRKDKRRNKK